MIRNLLFDLGGVIIDIRRQNCIDAFTAIGMGRVAELLDDYVQRGPAREIEAGTITPQQFCEEIRRYTGVDADDTSICNAFSAFIVGLPKERLHALLKLQEKYNILYLSNTNPIMWDTAIRPLICQEGKEVSHYFNKGGVKSFEAGCMKPAPEIFHLLEQQTGIKPEETLFFDDSADNCHIASQLGYNTVHVAPGTEFYNYEIPS